MRQTMVKWDTIFDVVNPSVHHHLFYEVSIVATRRKNVYGEGVRRICLTIRL